MISDEALLEFKQIWVDEFGEEISDEVATEEALKQACQACKGYLDVAKTFDGTEQVIPFENVA